MSKPVKLERSQEVVVGQRYVIVSGPGEGERGECVVRQESEFGLVWGHIRTGTGDYPTRWQLLARVE